MAVTGHGIVYPDSDGNVNLWEHLQLLAESVETALDANELDGGWIDLAGGVVTGTLRYRVKRDVVYVHFDGNASTTSGVTLTLNPGNALPAGARPSVIVRTAAYFSGFAGTAWVATNGDIVAWQNTGSTRSSVSGIIVYPTG